MMSTGIVGPFGRALELVDKHGVFGLFRVAFRYVFPHRLPLSPSFKHRIRTGSGLEVGGPSDAFRRRGPLPIYTSARSIDNVNFASETIWHENSQHGGGFQPTRGKAIGRQFVADATDLNLIEDGRYEYILSSHCLEHVANPVRALTEWMRVLGDEGLLILLVPEMSKTFDHLRPVTTIQHMIEDFERGVGEDDLTHVPEILALHDFSLDPLAGDPDSFRIRAYENERFRSLHHHVFDLKSLGGLLEYVGLHVHVLDSFTPNHLIAIATKKSSGERAFP